MTAQRIQRKRTAGWRMPEGVVYVGRPSRWGNPWVVGAARSSLHSRVWTAQTATEQYRRWLASTDPQPVRGAERAAILGSLDQLYGRDLACWCPLDQPCHADVLLEVANR